MPTPTYRYVQLRVWLSENNIDEIEAVIPDLTGIARGKLIPARVSAPKKSVYGFQKQYSYKQ
jgi:glutamine synthetase